MDNIRSAVKTKKTKEIQYDSDARYRRLFEAARDGILIIDAETEMVIDVNPFLIKMLGFSRQQIFKKKIWELGFFKDIAANKSNFAELLLNDFIQYENLPLETKKGEMINVEFVSHVYTVDSKKVIQCNIRDIAERMKAEAILRNNAMRYHALYDASPDSIIVVNASGNIVTINKQTLTLFGYTKQELLGKSIKKLIPHHFNNHQFLLQAYTVSPQKRQMGIGKELSALRKDGIEFPVEVALSPIQTENELNIIATIRDITDSKRAEDTLKRSEEMLLQTGEMAKVGGWEIDIATKTLTWSLETYRIHEVDPSIKPDLETGFNFYTPEARPIIAEAVNRALTEGLPWDLELPFITAKGNSLWVRAQGRPEYREGKCLRLVGAFQNITELKRTEEKVKESNRRFNLLMTQLNDVLWTASIDGTRVFDVTLNGNFKNIYGVPIDEFKKNPLLWIDTVLPDDKHIAEASEKELFEKGKTHAEYRIVKPDGSIVWLDDRKSLLYDENGKAIQMGGIAKDITGRKLAEEIQRASDIRYRRLFEAARDGILIIDAETEMVIDVNPFLVEMLGYSREQIFEKKIWELGFFKDIAANKLNFAELLLNDFIQYENLPLETQKGEMINVEFVSHVYTVDNKKVIQCNIRDITERMRAEETQNASDVRYRRLFEAARDGILIIDAETEMVIDVNPFLVEMLGYSREQIFEKKIWELGFFKDIAANKSNFAELLLNDFIQYENLPLETKKGEMINVEFVSHVYTVDNKKVIQCNIRDITERMKVEEALRNNETRYQALYEASPDSIIVVNASGKIVTINKQTLTLFGYTKQDLLGKSIESLVPYHFTKHQFLRQEYTSNPQIRQMGVGKQLLARRRDGTEFPIEVALSPVQTENELNIIATIRDITEKQKLEQQFMRSQRMESIGALAGGIAHDLNNILAPIMLSLEILSRKLPDEQSQHLLELILSNTRRGADLIKQVLSFARGVEGKHTIVQVRHLIDEIGKVINETFPKSILFSADVPKNLPSISADATQIHQVLMNLCVNARDAMPGGGKIEIKGEQVILDNQYVQMEIEAKPGPHVVITVTDEGEGIPKAIIEKIFEPFFTTKEIGKGTGLGLSTVLAITKSHNGFLKVYSEPGRGTTFKIFLPSSEVEQVDPQKEKENIPFGNGELILVVDDEASIRHITKLTLEAYGYTVITASEGTEAVSIYAVQGKKIALVITDMMMPFMDGAATIRALQKMNPMVKIIAVSGLKQSGEGFRQESVTFLQKPFTADNLVKVINQTFHRV